jgi:hypothetical protein
MYLSVVYLTTLFSVTQAFSVQWKADMWMMNRGSSVSVVSEYGLDDWAIGVWCPTQAKDFSSILRVQSGSAAHPASYPMGTWSPFPMGKARPGRDIDHSPPSSAEDKNEYKLYLLSPQGPSWFVVGQLYFFNFHIGVHLPTLYSRQSVFGY